MSRNIEPWDIQQMDLYTLMKISCMISDLYGNNLLPTADKTDYEKGKTVAYRSLLGDLRRLIEQKKTITKIIKQRVTKENDLKK